jgi:hypothetical protein
MILFALILFAVFYNILNFLFPTIFIGSTIYALFTILFVINLSYQVLIKKTNINVYVFILLIFSFTTIFLITSVNIDTEYNIFPLFSQYFGLFIFFFFLHFSNLKLNRLFIQVLLFVLIAEVFIEFFIVNYFGLLDLMTHYDGSASRSMKFLIQSGVTVPVSGFSGNRTVSGILISSVYWFWRSFYPNSKYTTHVLIMTILSILFTFSGGAALVFLILHVTQFNKINKILLIIPVMIFIGSISRGAWFGKISFDYVLLMVEYKIDQIMQFLTHFENDPGLIIYGTQSFSSKDFGILKMIGDTGFFTVLLYVFFLGILLRYTNKLFSNISLRHANFGIFTFFIGMFHYAPVFLVSGQFSLALFLSILMFELKESGVVQQKRASLRWVLNLKKN